MPSSSLLRIAAILVLVSLSGDALAEIGGRETLASDIEDRFILFGHDGLPIAAAALHAARRLFWTLATISLVWTMGTQILRQDIGEVLMELTRFTIVTGIFYWLLVNASVVGNPHGFVAATFDSFIQLFGGDPSDRSFIGMANELGRIGVKLYTRVVTETTYADVGDKLFGNLMAVGTLITLILMAAQFLMVLVVAWMMGFAGIFLLGFGGSRWTSPIAINFYKHVLAIGAVAMALGFIGRIGAPYLGELTQSAQQMRSSVANFGRLGVTLSVSVLMLVLSLRVPQILYSVVTGSQLGLYAGSAGMIGSAIGTGGMAAMASMSSWAQQVAQATQRHETAHRSSVRTDSVMDAVQRSSVGMSSMPEPFRTQLPAQGGAYGDRWTASKSSGGGAFRHVSSSTRMDMLRTPRLATPPPVNGRHEPADGATARAESSPDAFGGVHEARPDYEAEMSAIAASRASSSAVGTGAKPT